MCKYLEKNNSTFFKNLEDPSDDKILIKFNYRDSDQIDIINIEEYNKLITVKNKIDELEDSKLWDKTKKVSNDFELIYLPNKKMKCSSISKYEPLSRSYFKLWEIIHDFNLINNSSKIKMAGLAEGPGGFIESMINYRKKFKTICKQDLVYAITLKSVDKDIPGWNKANHFLKKNDNVIINYGKDGTGNIYNIDNIKEFAKNFNHDADLVTADGGFDFSTNFNKQEQSSLRIIFCEIVTALTIQKKGGSFVCKIYDSYTKVSVSFLYLLSMLYDYVYITKPFTSRPANSEKYVVCKGFKGIPDTLLKKLHIIVSCWDNIANDNFIYEIIDYNCIPTNFINMVKEYNTYFYSQQEKNIEKTLSYIEFFTTHPNYDDTQYYLNIIKNQIYLAFNWCKKYKCKINYDSEYLQNNHTSINKSIVHPNPNSTTNPNPNSTTNPNPNSTHKQNIEYSRVVKII